MHIGDDTLVLTGLFPEYVATLPRRGLRFDGLSDYVKAAEESYRIAAAFDQFEVAGGRVRGPGVRTESGKERSGSASRGAVSSAEENHLRG
jgi:hypothetical protein